MFIFTILEPIQNTTIEEKIKVAKANFLPYFLSNLAPDKQMVNNFIVFAMGKLLALPTNHMSSFFSI